MLRSRCLNGVATITNTDMVQLLKIVWPENMVKLSRQCCRVPSSVPTGTFAQPDSPIVLMPGISGPIVADSTCRMSARLPGYRILEKFRYPAGPQG